MFLFLLEMLYIELLQKNILSRFQTLLHFTIADLGNKQFEMRGRDDIKIHMTPFMFKMVFGFYVLYK